MLLLPNDNVSMSVGHLDQVLIVYSSMEHVTWNKFLRYCLYQLNESLQQLLNGCVKLVIYWSSPIVDIC